jgi:hypothetical protein
MWTDVGRMWTMYGAPPSYTSDHGTMGPWNHITTLLLIVDIAHFSSIYRKRNLGSLGEGTGGARLRCHVNASVPRCSNVPPEEIR